jgi:hypothetical protein
VSSKFYQVVQQTGPFGARRDQHLAFSKHVWGAREHAHRQRPLWRDGDIVVFACRLGPMPHRDEVLRLPAHRFEPHPSNRCGEHEPIAGVLICNRTGAHDGDHESWSGPDGRLLGSWARSVASAAPSVSGDPRRIVPNDRHIDDLNIEEALRGLFVTYRNDLVAQGRVRCQPGSMLHVAARMLDMPMEPLVLTDGEIEDAQRPNEARLGLPGCANKGVMPGEQCRCCLNWQRVTEPRSETPFSEPSIRADERARWAKVFDERSERAPNHSASAAWEAAANALRDATMPTGSTPKP